MTGHLVMGEDGPAAWAAGESAHWHDRIGPPVAGIQTFWERGAVGPSYRQGIQVADPNDVDTPVVVRLDFDAGPVWMVAGMPQAPGMQKAFIGGEKIMVVFTADWMGQIGFPEAGFLLPAGTGSEGRKR